MGDSNILDNVFAKSCADAVGGELGAQTGFLQHQQLCQSALSQQAAGLGAFTPQNSILFEEIFGRVSRRIEQSYEILYRGVERLNKEIQGDKYYGWKREAEEEINKIF